MTFRTLVGRSTTELQETRGSLSHIVMLRVVRAVIICFIFFPAKSGGLSIRTLLNSPDNYGNVCLHLAIKNGHREVSVAK